MNQEKIKIQKKEENKYRVIFSDFDGYVDVSTNQGKISDVSFSTEESISAIDLRKFPLQAVELLIKNEGLEAKPKKFAPKSRNSMTVEFLSSIAEQYVDALARNKRPLAEISNQTGAPRTTVARWVACARRAGVLT
jgi:hypothetical protein